MAEPGSFTDGKMRLEVKVIYQQLSFPTSPV